MRHTLDLEERMQQLIPILKKITRIKGPLLLIVKVEKSKSISKRVKYDPPLIHTRFMNSLKE